MDSFSMIRKKHKKYRHSLLLLIISLLVSIITLFTSASLPAEETKQDTKIVLAEGVGSGGDKAKARDDALADAQRRAVEQCVGLYIKSDTIVVNSSIVEDTIYRHSEGFVHSYEVVSEQYQDGEYRVTIRAKVRLGKIEEDLDDIWERLKITGSPRIIVSIDQPQPTDVPNLAQSIITEKLVSSGFKVLDEQQLGQLQRTALVKLTRQQRADVKQLAGLTNAADILITGQVNYRELGKIEPELDVYSCDGTLDARAIRIDTAEIVASNRGITERSCAAFYQNKAVELAIRTASEDWLARNLGLIVKTAVDPVHEYTLTISKCKYSDLEAIDSYLRELRFVRRTRLLSFNQGTAALEVEFVGSAKRLSTEITGLENPKLSVKGITANTVNILVQP